MIGIPSVSYDPNPARKLLRALASPDARPASKALWLANIRDGKTTVQNAELAELEQLLPTLKTDPALAAIVDQIKLKLLSPTLIAPPAPEPTAPVAAAPTARIAIKRGEGGTIQGQNLGGFSTLGGRKSNEDGLLAVERLLVVADGMGGHQGGEVASGMLIETIEADFVRDPDAFDLANAIRLANTNVFQAQKPGAQKTELMGTTVVGALIKGDMATVHHVGDSRAFIVRNGQIIQITKDDNFLEDYLKTQSQDSQRNALLALAKTKRLEDIQAPFSSAITEMLWTLSWELKRSGAAVSSAITAVVGHDADISPSKQEFDLAPGDTLILLTDGVSDYTTWEVFAQTVMNNINLPADRLAQVIANAVQNPGDNITVGVYHHPMPAPVPEPTPEPLPATVEVTIPPQLITSGKRQSAPTLPLGSMEGADSIVIEVDDAPQPAVVTKAPVVSVGVTPAAPAPASRPPKLPEAKRILVDPFAASAAAPAPETPVAEEVSEVTRVEDGGVEIIEVTEDSPSAAPLDFKGQMDAIRGQLDDLRQQWQAIKANIATAHANRRTNQEKIDAQREVIATIEQRKPDIAQIGSRRAAIIRKFEEEELEIQNECAENIKLVQSDRETVEAFEKDADQRICAARLRMTDALSEIDKGSPLVVRIKQIEESISQLEAYDSELQTYIDTQETTLTGIRNQVTSLSSQKDRLRLDEERRIEEERAQALEAVQQEADALDPFFSEIS